MPTFPTPTPLSIDIELAIGHVRIAAGNRTDTVVEIRPADPNDHADVLAAEQTRIEMLTDRLWVKGPRQRGLGLFNKVGEIEVSVEIPSGSGVRGSVAVGDFRLTGRLGDCRLKTSSGALQVEHAASVDLSNAYGVVSIDLVDGDATLHTGSGKITVGSIGGSAVIKNSDGDTSIGRIGLDLRARAANGDIEVASAGANVTAHTAYGDVRIGRVDHGSTVIETATGELEIGLPPGTAAMLDARTSYGRVRNELTDSDGPSETDRTVTIQARNGYGDIVIRRAAPA